MPPDKACDNRVPCGEYRTKNVRSTSIKNDRRLNSRGPGGKALPRRMNTSYPTKKVVVCPFSLSISTDDVNDLFCIKGGQGCNHHRGHSKVENPMFVRTNTSAIPTEAKRRAQQYYEARVNKTSIQELIMKQEGFLLSTSQINKMIKEMEELDGFENVKGTTADMLIDSLRKRQGTSFIILSHEMTDTDLFRVSKPMGPKRKKKLPKLTITQQLAGGKRAKSNTSFTRKAKST